MTEPLVRLSQSPSRVPNGRPAEALRGPVLPVSNGDIRFQSDREPPPGTPRWVKAFGIAFVVLVLLLAGLHLTGHTPTHSMPMHGMPMQDLQLASR